MNSVKEIKIISQNSNQSLEQTFNTHECKYVKFQISGEGTCDITTEGRLTNEDDFIPIMVLEDAKYEIIEKITSTGIYTVNCEGYYEVKIKINSIDDTLRVVTKTVR